jgi:hypothetical protein
MIETQIIDERGWWTLLVAPETEIGDRQGRLVQVDNVLKALSPVFRPLAIEVELIWRELDTGLPSPIDPEQPIQLLVLEKAQPQVAVRSSVAAPPPPLLLSRLDRDAIAECLKNDKPPDSNLVLDWLSIRSIAAAVRACEPIDTIKIEQIGHSIMAYETNWFAGPVGDRDFEVVPPAVMRLHAEDRIRFKLVVHWSGWSRKGSRERDAIEEAVSMLKVGGWKSEMTNGG